MLPLELYFFRILEIGAPFPVIMALKRSSEIVNISHFIEQGTPATFQVDPIDL